MQPEAPPAAAPRRAGELSVLVVSDGHDVPLFVAELARHWRCRPAGQAASTAEAARLARETSPDVVVVEVDTFERLDELAAAPFELEATSTVVVSGLPAEVALLTCMAAGANGFVGKPVLPGMVAAAVDAVVRGYTFVDPRSTEWLVGFALHGFGTGERTGLTLRQAQVVQLVRGGLTNRQIGAALGLSPETVKSHLRNAMRRLGVHDRWDATARFDRVRGRPAGDGREGTTGRSGT